MKHPYRITSFLLGMAFFCGISAGVAQAQTPLMRVDFESGTLQQLGWIVSPVPGHGPATTTVSNLPASPAPQFPAGTRSMNLRAAGGEASLLIGPGVAVGEYPAIVRMQITATAGGGSIAIGSLNYPATGNIGNTDGSVAYSLEMDSGRYVGSWRQVTVLMDPRGDALAPVVQLAVPQGGQTVTLYVDNVEVYSLNPNIVTDPTLRSLFGLTPGWGTNPTPTVTPTPLPGGGGGNIFVDDILTLSPTGDAFNASKPEVAFDRSDQYSVVAADQTGGFEDVMLRNVDAALNTVSDAFTVNQTFEDTAAIQPDIAIDDVGTRHIVWADDRALEKLFSIFLAHFDSFGNKLNEVDFEINRLFEETNTFEPSIAAQSSGDIVVTWYDDRNFINDVFVRRLRWNGASVQAVDDRDFAVNIPFENTNALDPDVAMNDNGNIVVVWSDDRANISNQKRNDIFARPFRFGTALQDGELPSTTPEISVTDFNSTVLDHATEPRIAFSAGFFLVVWQNENPTTGEREIRGAVLSDQGAMLVPEFAIDAGTNVSAVKPSVSGGQNGLFLITWHDNGSNEIYGRIYDAQRNAFLTESLSMLESVVGLTQTSVAMGNDNGYLMAWDSRVGNLLDIFAATGGILPNGMNLANVQPVKPIVQSGNVAVMGAKTLSKEEKRSAGGSKAERESKTTSKARN